MENSKLPSWASSFELDSSSPFLGIIGNQITELLAEKPESAKAMDEFALAILNKASVINRGYLAQQLMESATPETIRLLGQNLDTLSKQFKSGDELDGALHLIANFAHNIEGLKYYFDNIEVIEREIVSISSEHGGKVHLRIAAVNANPEITAYLPNILPDFALDDEDTKTQLTKFILGLESKDILELFHTNRDSIFRNIDAIDKSPLAELLLTRRTCLISAVAEDNSIIQDIILSEGSCSNKNLNWGDFIYEIKFGSEEYRMLLEIRKSLEQSFPNSPKNKDLIKDLCYEVCKPSIRAIHGLIASNQAEKIPQAIEAIFDEIGNLLTPILDAFIEACDEEEEFPGDRKWQESVAESRENKLELGI